MEPENKPTNPEVVKVIENAKAVEEVKKGTEALVDEIKREAKLRLTRYEIFKNIYRVCLLATTLSIAIAMFNVGVEIKTLKDEVVRIGKIAVQATNIAEATRKEVYEQVEEIQRDGIKLHFRLW